MRARRFCSAALAVLTLATAGCVSSKAGISSEGEERWVVGKTTAREVVEAWGNPVTIHHGVWVWRVRKGLGGKVRAGYMGIGAQVSSQRQSLEEYRLRFDEKNTLKSMEFFESISGGPGWTVNPWY